MLAYIFALGTVFTTLLGGWLSLKFRSKLHLFISFTAGVVLSIAFVEVLHELFEVVSEANLHLEVYLFLLLGGFLFFHSLEKIMTLHASHEDEYAPHRHPVIGYVTAVALVAHSFLDGLGIGIGFQLSTATGIVIAVAVLAHDFSDGINTASIMMLNNVEKNKIYKIIALDALAPILGVLIASRLEISASFMAAYLAIFAGFLIYIGASDLLPEAHSKERASKVLPLMLAGAVFGAIITSLAGH